MRDDVIKILVTGPFNTGKTTLVKTVSNGRFLGTEVPLTFPKEKNTTTVAFDFTKIKVKDKNVFLLGSPGQKRFSFMLDILRHGVKAFIFLIDEEYIKNPEEVKQRIKDLKKYGKPIVIGVNLRRKNIRSENLKINFIDESPVIIFSAKDKNSSLKLIDYTINLIENSKEKISIFRIF